MGYQVIGDEISLPKLMARYGFNKGVVGIGDNYTRSEIVAVVEKAAPDFQFINCVHESARISKYSSLGVGNVIMPGVTINASSEISNHCVLNTNSSLDHDCKMGDYSSLAPNSAVGGDCSIGSFSYVGIGASVFHGVSIGSNCIIGGGSIVTSHTQSNATYYGIPAKLVSERVLGDKYL